MQRCLTCGGGDDGHDRPAVRSGEAPPWLTPSRSRSATSSCSEPAGSALRGADLAAELPARAEQAAPRIAAQLRGDDDHEVAQTVIDLAAAGVIPDDPLPGWWATPLGRMTARSIGHPAAEAVTHSVAAAMLGVTRGTIAQLVHRRTLDRHPDGGVTAASVRARLARLGPPRDRSIPQDQDEVKQS